MNGDFDEFKSYCALANKLIDAMDKEQAHLGEYQRRFGEIPRQDLLELAGATELSDEQARMLRDGMELLVGYLGSAREGWRDDKPPLH